MGNHPIMIVSRLKAIGTIMLLLTSMLLVCRTTSASKYNVMNGIEDLFASDQQEYSNILSLPDIFKATHYEVDDLTTFLNHHSENNTKDQLIINDTVGTDNGVSPHPQSSSAEDQSYVVVYWVVCTLIITMVAGWASIESDYGHLD